MPLSARKSDVPIVAKKIWDLEDSRRADGGLPKESDLRGEIHPDLARYKGHWYCGLRESPLRRFRVIRSPDGERWESVRVFAWGAEGELGDPKFSVTADGALMINTWAKDTTPLPGAAGKSPTWTASVSWLTRDGLDWGHVNACPTGFASRSVARYSTTWFRGKGYSISSRSGDLYGTLDGKMWRLLVGNVFTSWDAPEATEEMLRSFDPNDIHQSEGQAPRAPSETALAFHPQDGTACAVSRTHPIYAIIGKASPPEYDEWTWKPARVDWDGDGRLLPAREKLGVQMGGPVLRYLSNGALLAAARADASTLGNPKGRLTLFLVDRDRAILKRWGDFDGWSHYPGVVEHEGELWITCGRQQKRDPFEVYLLRVPLPGLEE